MQHDLEILFRPHLRYSTRPIWSHGCKRRVASWRWRSCTRRA